MADTKFKLGRVRGNIEKMKRELPPILAIKSQNYFEKSFQNSGWEGEKWKEPQRLIPGTAEYKYSKWGGAKGRATPILVNRARLRSKVASSIRTKTFNLIRLVVDSPYAKRHNEGLDGMPQRKFMGDSPGLQLMQRTEIKKYVDKIWLV